MYAIVSHEMYCNILIPKQNDVKAIMYYLSSNIHGTFLLLTNEVPFRANIGIYQVIQKHGHIQKKK